MFTFLAIVHIIASIIMIAFILLQDPKGGGGALGMLGGGGGSKSLFGNTGGNQFLVSVTKWTAIIFAFTSIYLAALSSQEDKSVMDEYTQSAETTEKGDNTETAKQQDDVAQPPVPAETKPTTPAESDPPPAPAETKPTAPAEPDPPPAPAETKPTAPAEPDPPVPAETKPTAPAEPDPPVPAESDPPASVAPATSTKK